MRGVTRAELGKLILIFGFLLWGISLILSKGYFQERLRFDGKISAPIIIDLRGLRKASRAWGIPYDQALRLLMKASHGRIRGLGISLATIDELQAGGYLTYMQGWEILRYQPAWGYRAFGYRPAVVPSHLYINLNDNSLASELVDSLNMLLGKGSAREVKGPVRGVIEVNRDYNTVKDLELILLPHDKNLIKRYEELSSQKPILVVRVPYKGNPERVLKVLKKQLAEYEGYNMILAPSGATVLGYRWRLKESANSLIYLSKKFKAPLALLEVYTPKSKQKGIDLIASRFSSEDLPLLKFLSLTLLAYKPLEQRVSSVVLGVEERNVKMIYLSPGAPELDLSSPSLGMEELRDLLRLLSERLPKAPERIEDLTLSRSAFLKGFILGALLTRILITLALLLMLVGAILWAFPEESTPYLIGISVVGVISLISVKDISGIRELLIISFYALASSVIFVALLRRILQANYNLTLKVSLATLIVLLLGTITGLSLHILYAGYPLKVLGVIPVRGVKAILVIPILVVAFWGMGELKLWEKPIKFYQVFVGLLILGVLGIYLLRSGNVNMASGLELHLREVLRELFGVRPRFKEVLFGYPSLALGMYLLSSFEDNYPEDVRLLIALTLSLGAITLASVIDTFAHIHTPLLISLKRAFLGWILGLIFSGAILSILSYLLALLRKRGRRDEGA